MIKKCVSSFIFAASIFVIFNAWFFPGLITAGDFWPYSDYMYENYSINQYAWSPIQGNGFGNNSIPLLWIFMNIGIAITALGKFLGFSWPIVERFAYLFPFLLVSITSSVVLFRSFFPQRKFYLLSSAIYLLNPYILMVIAGGQILGIGMAYAMLPFVVYFFKRLTEKTNLRSTVIFSLVFAIQLLFDVRVFYITGGILFLLSFFILRATVKKIFLYFLVTPLIIIILLHSFWVLPLVIQPFNPISAMGEEYSTMEAVQFFSFATLENTISLLHPNYPENIFGKVGFMKAEFLLIPILAFSSLLFLKKKDVKEKSIILSFSAVGLMGAFLAKGAQEPSGEFYLFLFEYLPGMQMFRDPTKFYIFVAFSFSILTPYALEEIYKSLKNSKNSIMSKSAPFVTIGAVAVLVILIRSAFLGQIPGLFKSVEVPEEYITLEKKLAEDKGYYRTLWIPTVQRFSYYSPNHPTVSFFDLFKTRDYASISGILNDPSTEKKLQDSSIRYLIVPQDSLKEIYIEDRKYSEKIFKETLQEIENVQYIEKNQEFNEIGVFEVKNPKPHFWNLQTKGDISSTFINPSAYVLNLKNVERGQSIIFVENYDPGWVMKVENEEVISKKYGRFNSFAIPQNGSFSVIVTFKPQQLVNYGSIISVVTLIVIVLLLIKSKKMSNS